MNKDTKEILVGGLILGGLVAALFGSYGTNELSVPQGYAVNATFNRVDGLAEGADVQLAGIVIGKLEKMGLDKNYRAVLTLRITEDVKIPTDSNVAIHTSGLFGSKFLVLDPGGADETFKDGDEISFAQDAVLVDELLNLIIAQGKANRGDAGGSKKTSGGK